CYSQLVERLQGTAPEWTHVVLGSKARESFRLAEFSAYYRRLQGRFLRVLEAGAHVTYPDPLEHCGLCRWSAPSDARREADDHLSLVANMRRAQIARLSEVGITTVTELAGANGDQRP